MDELLKPFLPVLVQAPMVAILLWQIGTLWQDWKAEREQARQERLAMLQSLDDIYEQLFQLNRANNGSAALPREQR